MQRPNTIIGWAQAGIKRTSSEDLALLGPTFFSAEQKRVLINTEEGENAFFTAVCDGLGQHKSAILAAERILVELQSFKYPPAQIELEQRITNIGKELNSTDKFYAPGATIAGILFDATCKYAFWAGDSSIFTQNAEGLVEITQQEHTLFGDRLILKNQIGGGAKNGGTINFTTVEGEPFLIIICTDGAREFVLSAEWYDTDRTEIEFFSQAFSDDAMILILKMA